MVLLVGEVESAQAFFEKAAVDVFETFKFFALGLAALLVGCVEEFKELVELVAERIGLLCSFLKSLERDSCAGKRRYRRQKREKRR